MPHGRGLHLETIAFGVPFTSCGHLGSLGYPPHAPQLVGLNPVGLTAGEIYLGLLRTTFDACLLSVDTALSDVHLLIDSVLKTALQDIYACYFLGCLRTLKPREVKKLTQHYVTRAGRQDATAASSRAHACAHRAVLVSGWPTVLFHACSLPETSDVTLCFIVVPPTETDPLPCILLALRSLVAK